MTATSTVTSNPYSTDPYHPLTCLPASAVSYTYSHDDLNKGVVSVKNPDKAKYTDTLCTAFYVTAASWKYTNGIQWPQKLDQVDHLGKISVVGDYSYAAQVTCGQGDIYASTSLYAATLNPETYGQLTSPGHPFTETFLSGMGFTRTSWQGDSWIQDAANCYGPPAVTTAVGSCIAPNTDANKTGAATESVTLVFTNPSSLSETATITGNNGFVTKTVIIPGNTTAASPFEVVVNAAAHSGDTFGVSFNGGPVTNLPVTFAGCEIPGDPTFKNATCTAANGNIAASQVGGSITVDGNPHLTYTLHGPSHDGEAFANDASFPNGSGSTISDLAPGHYTITVAANGGYVLQGAEQYNVPGFPVDVLGPKCDGVNLTATFASTSTCVEGGPQDAKKDGGKFTADPAPYVNGGQLVIGLDNGILDWTVNGAPALTSPINLPNGVWSASVALSPLAITEGYTLSGQTIWNGDFEPLCPVVGAVFHPGATATNAVCTSGQNTDGVIDLTHFASETGDVTYTITKFGTSTVVYGPATNSVVNDTLVSLPAGHYAVHAKATDSLDGLVSVTPPVNADGSVDYDLVIGTSSTDCGDGNLAFTGGTIAWFGFVFAGGMLFLGFALLYVRRRGNRTAE